MSENQPETIPCSQAVQRLWDYLDDATSPADHAAVEDHLALCRRCCGELEFVKHLRQLLRSQQADQIPPHVIDRFERFVEEL